MALKTSTILTGGALALGGYLAVKSGAVKQIQEKTGGASIVPMPNLSFIGDIFKNLPKPNLTNPLDIIQDTFSNINDKINDIVDNAKQTITDGTDKIKDTVKKVTNAPGDLIDNTKTKVKGAVEKAPKLWKDILLIPFRGGELMGEELANKTKDTFNIVKVFFKNKNNNPFYVRKFKDKLSFNNISTPINTNTFNFGGGKSSGKSGFTGSWNSPIKNITNTIKKVSSGGGGGALKRALAESTTKMVTGGGAFNKLKDSFNKAGGSGSRIGDYFK